MADELDPFRRVKAFAGTGTVTSGDTPLSARFAAHQRGSGAIVINCEGDDPKLWREWPWDVEFSGETDAGQQVTAAGVHVVNSTGRLFSRKPGPNTRLGMIVNRLSVTGAGSTHTILRYGLTNVRTAYRRPLELRLGSFDVVIMPRGDADDVLKEARATCSVAVTAEATVKATHDQAEAVDETIRRMCLLLTFGHGSMVAWIYRDSLDEHGNVVATVCHNNVTKPYAASHILIDDAHMRAFIESTFPAWEAAESRWELRKAILGYTDAKLETDHLEARGVKTVVVLEHLKGVFLARSGREHLLPKALFKRVVTALRGRIEEVLPALLPDATADLAKHLVDGLASLNRTSFGQALRGAAEELRLPLDSTELSNIAKVRNRLVHAMRFADTDKVPLEPIEQYELLTTCVGRLILAALEYEGQYYDWTKEPPELVKLKCLPSQS